MLSKLKDTLLLVGSGTSSRMDLRNIFKDSYNLLEAENAAQAALLLEQNIGCILLVLVDLPDINGGEMRLLMEETHAGTEQEIPVIVLVDAEADHEAEERAFLIGAADVVLKPYSPMAVQRRVQVMADLFLHRWSLEKMVEEQSETIRNANQVVLDTLSAIIEYRSSESGNHVLRIRRFTKILLEEVARCCPEYELTDTTIETITSAAALHDIGKISVPDAILNKPDPLTLEEYEIMKTHTTIGGHLVQQLAGMGDVTYLRYAYNICLYHHERWDGNGYPCGLAGDDIPICAQVVGLTDAFDALTTQRVYKSAFPYNRAINMILNGECGQFSPKLLECFKHVREQLVELAHQYADGYSPKSDHIAVPLPGPVWKKGALDTLQLFQTKYHALLHYIDGTVFELDLDNEIYHLVYNSDLTLDAVAPSASFEDMMNQLYVNIHPDDAATIDKMRRFIREELYQLNLRRRTFSFRVFDPASETYQRHEMTFLRVDTGNANQRVVIAIYRRTEYDAPHGTLPPQTLHNSPALYGLISSALRCRCDRELTIEAGGRDLFSLVGYAESDLCRIFDNKLVRLIVPEDRAGFLFAVETCLKNGGKLETEFRMLHKNAEPVWVLAKGRLYMEADGQESFYFAIQDNSVGKAVQQKLLADIDRSQFLIEQSGSIIFDWDLKTDTMACSPKWVEQFGYKPISQNYSTQMEIASHFHPDDLPLVRSSADKLKNGTDRVVVDVRIADVNGRYLWTRITAIARYDAHGKPVRIVGLLQNIDELKRTAYAMKEQAERDALTKLLNKASTQTLAGDYLAGRGENDLAAVLILDLDNFKSVNDTCGHMYGDAVLTQVGVILRKMVRSRDIIGRIGGDEFLILFKDIPNPDILKERCELLLDTLRSTFNTMMPDLQISCSIGVSLAPAHGSTYGELFQHADEALYHIKNSGKDAYKIYDAQDLYAVSMSAVSRTTHVDSDDPTAMPNDSFVRYVFRSLYESRDRNATIQELLAFIGTYFNVSRTYIFENNQDNTACSNTFEWCNKGIPPEKDSLQNISYITDIPGWPEIYNERGVLYCTDITKMAPQFQAILEPQGIKSMLQCAIMDQGVFRGYVGFDECASNRLWTQEQISQLEFLSEVLAVFLINQRHQDRAAEEQAGGKAHAKSL